MKAAREGSSIVMVSMAAAACSWSAESPALTAFVNASTTPASTIFILDFSGPFAIFEIATQACVCADELPFAMRVTNGLMAPASAIASAFPWFCSARLRICPEAFSLASMLPAVTASTSCLMSSSRLPAILMSLSVTRDSLTMSPIEEPPRWATPIRAFQPARASTKRGRVDAKVLDSPNRRKGAAENFCTKFSDGFRQIMISFLYAAPRVYRIYVKTKFLKRV